MTLLTWPQLHVAVVVVAVVVLMGPAVVVVTGDGVDVDGVIVVGAAHFGQYKRYKIKYLPHYPLTTNLLW